MSQGIERGAQESSEEDQGALERFVRESFAEAEPPMVGAFAALLLSDAIELRTFDLLGEKAFEAILRTPAAWLAAQRQQPGATCH